MTDPVDTDPQEAESPEPTLIIDESSGRSSVLDRYFKLRERGTSVGREVRGGLVTFFTMAYIVVLTPIIIGGVPGEPMNADKFGDVLPMLQVAAVVALVAGVMSIIFGLVANYPFGIAAGLGISSLLAVTIAPQMSWPQAMGLVIVNGIIIVLLGLTGVRTAVFNAVPPELKSAIAAGIGAFIAFIGLINAGFVTKPAAAGAPPVQLGDDGSIATVPTLIFVIGVLLMGVLVVKKVPGGLLLGIIVMTVASIIVESIMHLGKAADGHGGWAMNIPQLPDGVGGVPDLSLMGNVDLFGAFTSDGVGVLIASIFVFTLLLSNFFDAMGTMTGLGKEGGLTDEKGNLPGIGRALVVEGTGAIVGGAAASSSATVLVESSAGIAEGARTGLANIVTGVLFLAAMFFTPLYSVVPMEAVSPALVIVGAMMMGQVRDIDFSRFELALPAFLTIVAMPFTYSIANGIGVGFISWAVMALARGDRKSMHPLLFVVAALFIAYFARGPISDLVG